MGDVNMSEGLFKTIFGGMNIGGVTLQPQMTQNEIVITLTKDELERMLLSGLDERVRKCITLEIEKDKLTLKIKLW